MMDDSTVLPKQPEAEESSSPGMPAGMPVNGLDADDREVLYALGYRLVQQRGYEQALSCFELLVRCSPDDRRFWSALAYTCTRLERYDQAILAYCMLGALFDHPERAVLNIADCLLKSGNVTEAVMALKYALAVCEDGPGNEATAKRASALLELLGHGSS